MDDIDYWRLSDELNIIQAALLTVGIDPASEDGAYVEKHNIHERPRGYEAAKEAIKNALRNGIIKGKLQEVIFSDINGNPIGSTPGSIDLQESMVNVESLRTMLANRGLQQGFFFPKLTETVDYLDATHSRYAPKLAAAVRAWQAVTEPNGKTPKQEIKKWLREHASKFGLADEDGKPNETGIEEISKVTNWMPEGGASRTPG